MNGPGGPDLDGAEAIRLFELRTDPTRALAGQADAVAAACHAMAVRFHQGGKLVVFGTGGSSTDAQHVAVEFVHPVIVGKRALPAISLTTDVATVTAIAERDGSGRECVRLPDRAPGRPGRHRIRNLHRTATARACLPACAPPARRAC